MAIAAYALGTIAQETPPEGKQAASPPAASTPAPGLSPAAPAAALAQVEKDRRWEYQVISDGTLRGEGRGLDSYGEEGWELVTATVTSASSSTTYYFKRLKKS